MPDILPDIVFDISPMIFCKLMPILGRDMAEVITGSEAIVESFSKRQSLTATGINDLVNNGLKNPIFNADDVGTDMLQRLSAPIDSCDLEIISMREKGDGAQNPELFKRPIEKAGREFIGDMRLEGKEHFVVHDKDPGETGSLQVMPIIRSHFHWLSRELDQTKFQHPFLSTLMAHS